MTEPLTLEPTRRPLTAGEQRLLRVRIRTLTAAGRDASRRAFIITGSIVVVLWILTLLASDAPWPVVTGFWLAMYGAIGLWARRDMRRDGRQMLEAAGRLESALRRNTAEAYDIRASSFAEFEEVEDEGACYAFQIGDERLVFVAGQEFYPGARFPSLDFSLAYVLDEDGQTVDLVIDKRGSNAAAARRIPAAAKLRLELPEHLEVRHGRLDELERVLGDPSVRT